MVDRNIKIVKKTIEDVLETYKNRVLQQESTNSQNINENTNNEEYTINDQMLLEMILLMIRGETIKYSSRKKKEKEKLQKLLEEERAGKKHVGRICKIYGRKLNIVRRKKE